MSDTHTSCCHIQTFGQFKIQKHNTKEQKELCLENQGWHAFAYLMTFRNKRFQAEELLSYLYEEAEGVDAVKLLNRQLEESSKVLDACGEAHYVKIDKDFYHWNHNIGMTIDTEVFEHEIFVGQSKIGTHPEEALAHFLKAIELYRGEYLKGCSQMWVHGIRNHYRNLFNDSVQSAMRLLKSFDRLDDMVKLTAAATKASPSDEKCHRNHIEALCLSNRCDEALDYYHGLSETLYSAYGLMPSMKMQSLFNNIKKATQIVDDLSFTAETISDLSAFYVEAEVFKTVYELEKRRSNRSNVSLTLGVVKLEETHETSIELMQSMKNFLEKSLRQSDCFTQWDDRSFYILFPYSSYETAEYVLDRLLDRFDEDGFVSYGHRA